MTVHEQYVHVQSTVMHFTGYRHVGHKFNEFETR